MTGGSPRRRHLLREAYAEALHDPTLVTSLESVLAILESGGPEAKLAPTDHLKAVGRELTWCAGWLRHIVESWSSTEDPEECLAEVQSLAEEVERIGLHLAPAGQRAPHLGDGLHAWGFWGIGQPARDAVVTLLQSLEQSVERVGAFDEGQNPLLADLWAAQRTLETAAHELDSVRGHSDTAAARLAAELRQVVARLESLRAEEAERAAGRQAAHAAEAAQDRPGDSSSSALSGDLAVPLPLVAIDLLLSRGRGVDRAELVDVLAGEASRRPGEPGMGLHSRAIAALVLGDLVDGEKRRRTLTRLGREIAAGRAARQLVDDLGATSPESLGVRLQALVDAGRVTAWEASALQQIRRGNPFGDEHNVPPTTFEEDV